MDERNTDDGVQGEGHKYILSPDEELILQSMAPNQSLAKKELADMTGISSSRLSRLLRKLTDRHLLTKVGAGRGAKYYR